jgi:ribonuclease-3
MPLPELPGGQGSDSGSDLGTAEDRVEPARDSQAGPDLDALQSDLGLRFKDPLLLRSAFTHRSYLNEVESDEASDNERLEFLGDALVDFVAAEYLYREHSEADEGLLTRLRSALVCEPTLAGFARQLDLGSLLRMGRGEEANGGRRRDAVLCDAFEALVGAVFLDRGFEASERLVLRFIVPELEIVLARRRLKDAKSRFQELAQQRWRITPDYRISDVSGPDHAKTFVVEARLDGEILGRGRGASKAAAAQIAAEAALQEIEDRGDAMPERRGEGADRRDD